MYGDRLVELREYSRKAENHIRIYVFWLYPRLMGKRFSVSTILLSLLAVTSSAQVSRKISTEQHGGRPVAQHLGKFNHLKAAAIAPADLNGRKIGNWIPVAKGRQRNVVTTWQPAFDACNTDMSTDTPFSAVYGAPQYGAGTYFYTPDSYNYISTGELQQMSLNAGDSVNPDTHGRMAQRVWIFQHTGGPATDLVIYFRCTNDFGSSAAGAAFTSRRGGYYAYFPAVAPGDHWFEVDFSTFVAGPTTVKGIDLPSNDAGAFNYWVFGYSGGAITALPAGVLTSPLLSAMCSPGDPYNPGTNPTSSADHQWDDDNPSDYAFQNTGTDATSEYYSYFSGNDIGNLHCATALFVDPSAHVIKGTLGLTGRSTTPISRPSGITYQLYNGTTLVDQGYAPVADDMTYTILDPNPGTGGSYSLIARAAQWLGKKFTVNTTATPVTTLNMTLPYTGDVNYDGTINLSDFSILSACYGYTSASAQWNTVVTGTSTPADADINEDGTVNLVDFSLLSSNYGRSSDTP